MSYAGNQRQSGTRNGKIRMPGKGLPDAKRNCPETPAIPRSLLTRTPFPPYNEISRKRGRICCVTTEQAACSRISIANLRNLRQYHIIGQERFASKFFVLTRRGFEAILSYCKKSQQSQGAKFPQSAAAFIVRCCLKNVGRPKALPSGAPELVDKAYFFDIMVFRARSAHEIDFAKQNHKNREHVSRFLFI